MVVRKCVRSQVCEVCEVCVSTNKDLRPHLNIEDNVHVKRELMNMAGNSMVRQVVHVFFCQCSSFVLQDNERENQICTHKRM